MDSWNRINDEIEARRYREEVPLLWRAFYAALRYGLAIGIPAGLTALWIYASRR